ncbi:hypothetical protein [Halobacillus sp. B23F22_1]|uniref:hypothetical protein n=1 Tax=Halobacillus sp. B23F22_1 TaxID=3459514 RepID=UPI00373E6DD0
MSPLEAAASSTTNGKVVASLVLGILSIVTMIIMVVGHRCLWFSTRYLGFKRDQEGGVKRWQLQGSFAAA